jgi:hypothetical protein
VAGCTVLVLFLGAAVQAQGPAGAGAGQAAAADNSTGTHSFNPMKWVKRDSKTADDQLNSDAARNERLTARLHEQGLLTGKAEARDACANFKELSDCVAALYASQKLGLDFECVKVDMTHVHSATDPVSCKRPAKDEAIGLPQAIRLLKPDANAKAEAKEAERAAKEDLKATK